MPTATKPRTTWLLKGCPRCGTGDLLIENQEQTCLQCGYFRDLNPKKNHMKIKQAQRN